jgi:small multidrug resistance family-3 protein
MPRYLTIWAFLIVATTFEASGDALVRMGLFERVAVGRIVTMVAGAALLFGYGVMLNLAPLPFERVVGLYIATLFVVWQTVSFLTFRSVPSLPVVLGGALIIAGGLLVSFWRTLPASSAN